MELTYIGEGNTWTSTGEPVLHKNSTASFEEIDQNHSKSEQIFMKMWIRGAGQEAKGQEMLFKHWNMLVGSLLIW